MKKVNFPKINTLTNPQLAEFSSKKSKKSVISISKKWKGVEVEQRFIAFPVKKERGWSFIKIKVEWPIGMGNFPEVVGTDLKCRLFLSNKPYDSNSYPWVYNSGDKENPRYHVVRVGKTQITEPNGNVVDYKGPYIDENEYFGKKPTEGVIWLCPVLFGNHPLVAEQLKHVDLTWTKDKQVLMISQMRELIETESQINVDDLVFDEE